MDSRRVRYSSVNGKNECAMSDGMTNSRNISQTLSICSRFIGRTIANCEIFTDNGTLPGMQSIDKNKQRYHALTVLKINTISNDLPSMPPPVTERD